MTTTNKAINALSLAKRAGKLSVGYEAVKQAMISGKAKLTVTTQDISERTLRNAESAGSGIPFINLKYDQGDVQAVFGRKFVIAAVTDDNFKNLVIKAYKDDLQQEEVNI